ncbi:tripartite tricarboxylate transporter substrate-binding protein [Teichococcus aestuarii]|uniref:tripartite tricarboxylate transporter substrate-binding protein n=1 Tax=Teichococcus aestuarii TaxID=568898 RepID=UPI003622E737
MLIQRRGLMVAATAGGLAAGGLASPTVSRAQTSWPDRPIRLIVPWPPGGSTDTVGRIFQPKLQEILGKPVVIENRGGASGAIGAGEAARAEPDGYTWVLVYDTQATNESVMRLPFKTMEAFTPVSLVGTGPLALVAHQTTPYRSYKDIVEAAKKAPETLNFATSGVGGRPMWRRPCCSSRAATSWCMCPIAAVAPPRRTRWRAMCRCSCRMSW